MSEDEERYKEYERKFFPSGYERNVFIDPIKGRFIGVQPHDPLYVNPTRLVEDLRFNVYDNYQTTDVYVESKVIITIDYEKILLWIKNHHTTNSAVFCIETTSNSDDWECHLKDAVLEPGESRWESLVLPWYKTRFKAKSLSAGQAAILEGWITRR